jgi:hypothetical protein
VSSAAPLDEDAAGVPPARRCYPWLVVRPSAERRVTGHASNPPVGLQGSAAKAGAAWKNGPGDDPASMRFAEARDIAICRSYATVR